MQNGNNHNQKDKILKLVRDVAELDKSLREKYKIGDKFRFIRDRINALLTHTEEHLAEMQKKTEQKKDTLQENEVLVYVYLFNAQGVVLQSWYKIVSPSVFYDHSVNRPVYSQKDQIEAYIRSKTNKVQHGFLTIAVPSQAIVKLTEETTLKDSIGNPLIKVKEGSLQFNRLISFTHNGNDYSVNENGELVKKKSH